MQQLSEYDYNLPKELIAQEPLKKRSDSRLLVVGESIEHKKFSDIVSILEKDDVLVLNNSKVIPARLMGKKETGGKIEILLIRKLADNKWSCFVKGSIKDNARIFFAKGYGIITKKDDCIIDLFDVPINEIGIMPVPPYIKKRLSEPDRYNTVFAQEEGSIAAPTAGLHFTQELFKTMNEKGVKICFVTLHVGPGTFLPVKTKDICKHHMHEEYYTISEETANSINARKNRLFIIGTTTLRALESSTDKKGIVNAETGSTKLFIYPPYKFKLAFYALITNFHLPKSTLLMLVSAIIGRERIIDIYTQAIKEKYRFFSFGDAMIVRHNS